MTERVAHLCLLLLFAVSVSTFGEETVRILVPNSISLVIPNVRARAVSTSVVSFQNAVLGKGRALRISVRPASDFSGGRNAPGLGAAQVSWTVTAAGGTGINGTLDKNAFMPVYQSAAGATVGSFTINWTMAPPAGRPRAGFQNLTLQWKIESVQP